MAHNARMVDRPCRSNSDLKRLWQLLLPDTPMPACGTHDETDDAARGARPREKRDDGEKREKLLGRRE